LEEITDAELRALLLEGDDAPLDDFGPDPERSRLTRSPDGTWRELGADPNL
jgi:hypothetical protein